MTSQSVLTRCAFWFAGALLAGATLAQPASEMTGAEVKKIDKSLKKITLKHEEIKSLDMPPMTMVFTVKNPALFDALKKGDKVRFAAERVNGATLVTRIDLLSQ